MFVSVFLAILAAAAVIYGFLNRNNRLEQWEMKKQECIVHLKLSEREKHELIYSRTESKLAFILQMERRHALEQDDEKLTEKLISLLEHKPSFLGYSPAQLTKEEFKLLENQKWLRDGIQKMMADTRGAEKAWMEAAANADREKARIRGFEGALDKLGK